MALRAALLTALLLALAPATAVAAPPWQSAERMQAALFDAQTALLLDGRAPAGPSRAAAEAFRGPLANGLRRDAPAAYRAVPSALGAAARAAASGDDVGLAAARGRLRAAVLRGSYAVTLAAVRRGDARTAAGWLLLRDFRKATRFTRPGVDATTAVRRLGRGRGTEARAALAVRKDLLDAYQARLADELEEAAVAEERGFAARRAEAAAIAAGYFEILADEYRKQRGAAELDRARAAFADLEGASGPAFAAALDRSRQALDGFTAAPFTPAEQARRAQQLVRFLDLVPIEYRDGTDDGKVTIPFEIQEAIAFRDGAEAAFADLEATLERTDARATAGAERELERLKAYVEDAGSGRKVVDEGDVEASHERASELLDGMFPDEWKESDSQSDFDLIGLTLDRMEAAVAAGRVQAGRAGPARGLRVLRVRAGAVPALDRPGRRRRGGGAGVVRERRARRAGQADRPEAPRARAARDPPGPRRGARGGRRRAGRGREQRHRGHQRRRDRVPRGPRSGADPGRRDGQPLGRGPPATAADADRRRRGAGGQRDHVHPGPDRAHVAGAVRRETRGGGGADRHRGSAAGAELVLPPRLLDRPHLEVPQAPAQAAGPGRDRLLLRPGGRLRAARLLHRLPRGLRDRAVPAGARAELRTMDRAGGGRAGRPGRGRGGSR